MFICMANLARAYHYVRCRVYLHDKYKKVVVQNFMFEMRRHVLIKTLRRISNGSTRIICIINLARTIYGTTNASSCKFPR